MRWWGTGLRIEAILVSSPCVPLSLFVNVHTIYKSLQKCGEEVGKLKYLSFILSVQMS